MKRFTPIFLILALLMICRTPLSAEEHEHFWSYWDYFHSDSTYHYGQRHCYDCEKVETKKEKHALMPYPSYYSADGETCYAHYNCRICYNDVKIANSHKWTGKISGWKWFSDEKHMRTVDKTCSQCKTWHYDMEYGNHNLGFHWITHKGKKAVYWGCDICGYAYGNYVYYKTNKLKWSIRLSRYLTCRVILPHTDKIKSIKVTSGKKRIKVKKLSGVKIKVTPKKKGTAKFKITSKAGVTYTVTVKVK